MNDYFDNYDVIEKNLKYLTDNHREIYEAYEKFGKLIHEKGGPLEEKTRWLIKVSLSAECQNEYSLRTHILKALNSGCRENEIEHAILLVAPTCGFPKMMRAMLTFRQVMDSQGK
ncbi:MULTISPECIES: carboxymuconolactone decarboxylase family protein [unclassified Sedimentibacter]|uniref:carboxymuconolactone decarboxylase family protein n=1 Tax=unclassified Sedimentibacter TaxID=2649220 RepID=UPI0027DECE01|nr:carboxymuconolactone decarboxylase family protein [Sedimentibacter sp. MB35-C1]WMJ76127.1 carboxymuconolactone decarboxylase family protein [Sedimentibacter sp. MB35-C1]